jgi:hypothetical protein
MLESGPLEAKRKERGRVAQSCSVQRLKTNGQGKSASDTTGQRQRDKM